MVKCNELVFKLFVRAYNWVIKRRSMDPVGWIWGLEAGGLETGIWSRWGRYINVVCDREYNMVY